MLLHQLLSAGDSVLFGRTCNYRILWRVLRRCSDYDLLRSANELLLFSTLHNVLCTGCLPSAAGILRVLPVVVAATQRTLHYGLRNSAR